MFNDINYHTHMTFILKNGYCFNQTKIYTLSREINLTSPNYFFFNKISVGLRFLGNKHINNL
jgi:hypothetical protein